MATHPRLGIESPASKMTAEVLQLILEQLSQLRSEVLCVVIDTGSHWSRVGFAGDPEPRAVFRTLVARPRLLGYPGLMQKDAYVGEEAWSKRATMQLNSPVARGIVSRFDDMEKVYNHAFYNELRIAPEEQPVLLTEGLLNPKASREMLAQVMFETFAVPAMWVGTRAELALVAAGRATGLVVESGDQISWAAPVVEGCVVPHAARLVELGGQNVSEELHRLLSQRGIDFSLTHEWHDVKEKLAYVELDYERACRAAHGAATVNGCGGVDSAAVPYSYPDSLPGGGGPDQLNVPADALFGCAEVLFSAAPLLRQGRVELERHAGRVTADGLAGLAHDALMACDAVARAELAANVVVVGGTMKLPGMAARLHKELASRMPASMEVHVTRPAEPQHMAWRGASCLAWQHLRDGLNRDGLRRDLVEAGWVMREEYDDEGPTIVHRRCLGVTHGCRRLGRGW